MIIHRSPDPAESAAPSTSTPPSEVAPPPPPDLAPPPAATTVIEGEVSEETLRLRESLSEKEEEIEELKRQVKDREITVCEYQDKIHSLQNPAPVAVRKKSPEPKPFVLGRFV